MALASFISQGAAGRADAEAGSSDSGVDLDGAGSDSTITEPSIGEYLRRARRLTDMQVDRVLEFQRMRKCRFGEAAIALGYVKGEDVLWALSQQFQYPLVSNPGASLNHELVVAVDPFGEMAETFRDLRSQLLADVFAPEHPKRALAVLSADVGDGKSFFAANMAVALSQLGGRTLLIDADLRTPRQHELFKLADESAGLSALLSGRAWDGVIHQVPELPGLFVLPVGVAPPNPLELVQRPTFGLLVHELLHKFDYVLVDTPAASHGADARVIAGRCGAAMVVGRRGRTSMKALRSLTAAVGKAPTRLAGVMINEH